MAIIKFILGIIAFPVYFLLFHKTYGDFSTWYDHHLYELVGTTAGAATGIYSITSHELKSILLLDLHDLLMVFAKTILAAVVAFVLTKILKKLFPDE